MNIDFQDYVERVKTANPIEDVIEGSGTEYKLQRKHGAYLRGETHQSLVVRVDEQYYVWNSKGERGDIFNWLEARNKWDFWSALQWLAERAKIEMPKRFRPEEEDAGKRITGRIREDAWGLAQRKFAAWLWKDEEALAYVRARGWTDETIRESGIGFSGRGTAAALSDLRGDFELHGIAADNPLAAAILGYKGDIKAWGKQWEIEVQDNWLEWGMVPGMCGRTRIVYPHITGGRVKYLSARNILGAEVNKEGRTVKSFNLPEALAGKRQPFYNHAYGRRAEECVVVEGQADAITLGQWGIPAMAIAGTAWEDQREALEELRKRHEAIYLGMDADEAGMQALRGKKNDWPLAEWLGPMARVVEWGGK